VCNLSQLITIAKIAFVLKYCQGKDVLDIGCVQHVCERNHKNEYTQGTLVASPDFRVTDFYLSLRCLVLAIA
jgi:hypothetical protein